ncbi:MAG: 4-phosphoerythronate dehydrogenase PdxB [Bacteroidales bacterium]|nr:4-phosphoerythronate dehydrogenase PdxB [Candidatus Cryptobacteroides aphodequi]
MKIVIDDKIPFIRGVFEPFAEVQYLPGAKIRPEDVRDADALITRTRTACNEALLKGSSVKMIASATIGFDHIDTAWVEAAGIDWTNSPGCNSWSVKQYISSVLVSLAKKHSLDLSHLTLGVVGVGNVGSKVAEAAQILGCKVLLNDPPRERREGSGKFVSLDEIVAKSDIITLHVPLTKEGEDATWHLFDRERLAALRADQILINSSRGPVVDNAALKDVLLGGGIKAAVLDVWEGEPDLDPELVEALDYSTPHIAGYSADGKANGTTMSVRAVAAKLGLPLTDWTAEGVPAPKQSLSFEIDAAGKSLQEVLSEAILYTYDVAADSCALRSELGAFERLRGDYPIRREPRAFTVTLRGATPEMAERLEKLEFKVQ